MKLREIAACIGIAGGLGGGGDGSGGHGGAPEEEMEVGATAPEEGAEGPTEEVGAMQLMPPSPPLPVPPG